MVTSCVLVLRCARVVLYSIVVLLRREALFKPVMWSRAMIQGNELVWYHHHYHHQWCTRRIGHRFPVDDLARSKNMYFWYVWYVWYVWSVWSSSFCRAGAVKFAASSTKSPGWSVRYRSYTASEKGRLGCRWSRWYICRWSVRWWMIVLL